MLVCFDCLAKLKACSIIALITLAEEPHANKFWSPHSHFINVQEMCNTKAEILITLSARWASFTWIVSNETKSHPSVFGQSDNVAENWVLQIVGAY